MPTDRIAEAVAAAADADGLLAVGGGSAIDPAKAVSAQTGLPLVSVPTTYSGAEWTSFFGVRDPDRRMKGGGAGAHLAGDRLRAAADARPAARARRRDGDERARALRRGALRRTAHNPTATARRSPAPS